MKNNITNREDLFLAKIAGYDVDVKTMTPPTASNVREKILLDIADKVNNQGNNSSANNIMTVTLTTDDGWSYQANASIFEIAKAVDSNVPVFIRYGDDVFRVAKVHYGENGDHPISIKAFTDYAENNDIGVKRIEAWKDTAGDDYWSVTEKHSTPEAIVATTEKDAQTGKLSIILNRSAGSLYDYVRNSRSARLYTDLDDSGNYMEMMIPVEAYRLMQGGNEGFLFRCKGDVSDPTTIFQSGFLSNSDAVVLTEVTS